MSAETARGVFDDAPRRNRNCFGRRMLHKRFQRIGDRPLARAERVCKSRVEEVLGARCARTASGDTVKKDVMKPHELAKWHPRRHVGGRVRRCVRWWW